MKNFKDSTFGLISNCEKYAVMKCSSWHCIIYNKAAEMVFKGKLSEIDDWYDGYVEKPLNKHILANRAKSCGMTVDAYISFCIDRTLRTPIDDLQIELQQFKEKIK